MPKNWGPVSDLESWVDYQKVVAKRFPRSHQKRHRADHLRQKAPKLHDVGRPSFWAIAHAKINAASDPSQQVQKASCVGQKPHSTVPYDLEDIAPGWRVYQSNQPLSFTAHLFGASSSKFLCSERPCCDQRVEQWNLFGLHWRPSVLISQSAALLDFSCPHRNYIQIWCKLLRNIFGSWRTLGE